VVTLAIWGEVITGTILTKCGTWADIVDIITCALFGNCWLRGVDVHDERGKFAFAHRLEVSLLQHWSQYRVI